MKTDATAYHAIIFGLGRYGGALGLRLIHRGWRVLGVDFSPSAVARWRLDGHAAVYGDGSDPEFINSLPLGSARWVVSTVRDQTGVGRADASRVLIQTLRDQGFGGRIAVTCDRADDAERLKDAGAHLVLEPFSDAADRAAELLTSGAEPERLEEPPPDEQRDMGA